MTKPEGFGKAARLRKPSEFQRVHQQGTKRVGKFCVVYACPSGLTHARLGLAVSRKVGNAVQRNRAKRWFREIFRRHQGALAPGMDLVIHARPRIVTASFAEVKVDLLAQCGPRAAAR